MDKIKQEKRLFLYECQQTVIGKSYQFLIPAFVALQGCFVSLNIWKEELTASALYSSFLEGMQQIEGMLSGAERFLIPGDWCVFVFFLFVYNRQRRKKLHFRNRFTAIAENGTGREYMVCQVFYKSDGNSIVFRNRVFCNLVVWYLAIWIFHKSNFIRKGVSKTVFDSCHGCVDNRSMANGDFYEDKYDCRLHCYGCTCSFFSLCREMVFDRKLFDETAGNSSD